MSLNANLALNSLSFGFCSYNILKEFYKTKDGIDLFLIGNNLDLSSFDKASQEFKNWIQHSVQKASTNFSRKNKEFSLWHIQNSESQYGEEKNLFTFFELDSLTPLEVNVLNQKKNIFVSSQETKDVFEQYGVKSPVHYVPLGYDTENFYILPKRVYPEDVTVFTIAGKFEKRKATERVIKAWVKKFGNNNKFMLHLSVFNPFFKPEDNAALINNALEGKRYSNINILPYTKTLTELNQIYNATDIVIDMSLGEGWSLPAYHMVGLGKHAIIHNCSAMKGWANTENAVLIDPIGKIPAEDGIFFHKGAPINQGNFYNFNDNDLFDAFDKVLARKAQNPVNVAGLDLSNRFKWSDTVDVIKKVINR